MKRWTQPNFESNQDVPVAISGNAINMDQIYVTISQLFEEAVANRIKKKQTNKQKEK